MGLLKADTESFIKYCHSSNCPWDIDINMASSELCIKRRRMHDIVTVLENVGVLRKAGKRRYAFRGTGDLIADPMSTWSFYDDCTPLSLLTRIFFHHLEETGKAETVIKTAHQISNQKKHRIKMNRRLYDIINILDGAGIINRAKRELKLCPSPPLMIGPPPPPPLDDLDIEAVLFGTKI